MSDTDTTPEGQTVDYATLFPAAEEFLSTYCEATGTDRTKLDRQVLTVSLTDAEGVALGMTLDLSVQRQPGNLFDSAPADQARADIEAAASGGS